MIMCMANDLKSTGWATDVVRVENEKPVMYILKAVDILISSGIVKIKGSANVHGFSKAYSA